MAVITVSTAGQTVATTYTTGRPVGAGITPYETLPRKNSVEGTLAGAKAAHVSFLPGTYPFTDFDSNGYGCLAWTNVLGLRGSGIDQTIFQMAPMTSTKASQVPAQSTGSTNQLALMRAGSASVSTASPVTLTGFTLAGTNQGHLYNGLNVYETNGALVQDVKITGIPGNNSANPGETFSISTYRGHNATLSRVEVDGRNSTGTRTAASGLGINFDDTYTVTDCNLHDMQYGYGATNYQATGTINYIRTSATNNLVAFNFERCVGNILFDTCTFSGNRGMSAGQPVHMIVDSDLGSAKMRIVNPVFDGTKFTVCIHATYPYGGALNKQLASDITLIVAGVIRPDLLRIVTDYR